MNKNILAITFVSAFLFAACERSPDPLAGLENDEISVVSNAVYANAPNGDFQLDRVEITGDSLLVSIRYGGGCGDVYMKLLTSDMVMESLPVQRNIKLSFKDKDDCEAFLFRVFTFDLKPARVYGNNSVVLKLEGWDTALEYTY